MSEQLIINSDLLIEIFNKGCAGMNCIECPFHKLALYCNKVEL